MYQNMVDLPTNDDIEIGDKVLIESKNEQGTGKLTEGIVKQKLTRGYSHPYGIKVELENGETGRVKKLSLKPFNVLKILDRHFMKEDLQDILLDFDLPYSKNKEDLLNLIFQNKTVFEKAVKELVNDLDKEGLVEICEECNFNSKGKVKELREMIMKNFISAPESNSSNQSASKTVIKSDVTIPKDEDAWNEFKSTYRLDLKRFEKGDGTKTHSKDVEKEIPVTISAMANKEGGTLFIGVDDDGNVLGLENDYELLNLNDDKFQRMIWETIKKFIKNITYVSKLQVSLINKESKKICIIKIPHADEAIFVHDDRPEESYVRIGSRSEKFSPSDFMKHCKTRFKE